MEKKPLLVKYDNYSGDGRSITLECGYQSSEMKSSLPYDNLSSVVSELPKVDSTKKNNNDKKGDPNDKGKQPSDALDGGYGWVVVLGVFLSHFISRGFDSCDGIYYLVFREKYGKSAVLTSYPGAIVATLRFLLGPLASAICNRYSVRASVMLGGIFFAVGVFLTGFVENFYFLFLTYGLLQGIGRGLFTGPALMILNRYFDTHRSLAAGLGTSGAGVGTLVLVQVTKYLFDNYSFRDVFFIQAGIALQVLVIAIIYRPLSWNNKFRENQKLKTATGQTKTAASEANGVIAKTHELKPNTYFNSQNKKDLTIETDKYPNDSSNKQMRSLDIVSSVDGSVSSVHELHDRDNDKLELTKTKPKASPPCGVVRRFLRYVFDTMFPVDECNQSKTSNAPLVNYHLLKNPVFLLYCISIMLFTMAYKSAYTFIAALAEGHGVSSSNAVLILSLMGAADTAGRISAGVVLSIATLRPHRQFFFTLFIFAIGILSFIMPQLQTVRQYLIVCLIYGMFTGAYTSQKSVILADMLGAAEISSSFGLLLGFQGLGVLVGVPLSGALKDLLGSYDGAFYLGGAGMAVAGLLMLASNLLRRRTDRNSKSNDDGSACPSPGDAVQKKNGRF